MHAPDVNPMEVSRLQLLFPYCTHLKSRFFSCTTPHSLAEAHSISGIYFSSQTCIKISDCCICLGKDKQPHQENALEDGIGKLNKKQTNKQNITEHSTYPSPLLKIYQATLLEGKRRDQSRRAHAQLNLITNRMK